ALSQGPCQHRARLVLYFHSRIRSAPLLSSSVVPTVAPAVRSRAGSLPNPSGVVVSSRAQSEATSDRQPGIRRIPFARPGRLQAIRPAIGNRSVLLAPPRQSAGPPRTHL